MRRFSAIVIGLVLLVALSVIGSASPCRDNSAHNVDANENLALHVDDSQYKDPQERLKAEEEKLHEQRLARERAKIEEQKNASEISAGVASVSVSEYYDYNLGGTPSYMPSLYVSVYDYGDVDSVSLELQLPKNINPTLSYSNVQVEYKYDSSTGILDIEFIDIATECSYYSLYAEFRLENMKPMPYPITNTPTLSITPTDFGANSSGYVNINLGAITLDGIYNWTEVLYEVSDVKTISVVSTTPTANSTHWYNDTSCYGGDCWSYAHAHWYSYDVSSLPSRAANFSVENDIDEVDVYTTIDLEKYTWTNAEVISVSIPHTLWQYTDNEVRNHQTLNPVNLGDIYGIIKGTVYDRSNVVPGATVYAYSYSGPYNLYLYTLTDQNGNYSFKVPSGLWYVYAYTANFSTPTSSVNVASGVVNTVNLYGNYTPTARITIEPIDTALDPSVSYNITVENTFNEMIYVSIGDWASVYLFNESKCWWEFFHSDFDWTFSTNNFYLNPGESKTVKSELEYIRTKPPLVNGKYKEYLDLSVEANNVWNKYGQDVYFSRGMDSKIYTDNTSYTTGDSMKLSLKVTNSGDGQTVDAYIWLENSNGIPVYIFASKPSIYLRSGLSYNNPSLANFTLPDPLPFSRTGTYIWKVAFVNSSTNKIESRDSAAFDYIGPVPTTPSPIALEELAEELKLKD